MLQPIQQPTTNTGIDSTSFFIVNYFVCFVKNSVSPVVGEGSGLFCKKANPCVRTPDRNTITTPLRCNCGTSKPTPCAVARPRYTLAALAPPPIQPPIKPYPQSSQLF